MSNPSAPNYEPEEWNSGNDASQNNCYDYVLNNNDFMFNSPGVIGNFIPENGTTFDDAAEVLVNGAISDGLQPLEPDENTPPGHYRVALYASANADGTYNSFHWVREDADGGLSHKMGHFAPERLDRPDQGNFPTEIYYNQGLNYRIIGEFAVPQGGIDIGLDNFLKNLSEEARANVRQIIESHPRLREEIEIASMLATDPVENPLVKSFIEEVDRLSR